MSANTFTYNRTASIRFLADNMGKVLRDLIRENGLSPERLTEQWEVLSEGIRQWAGDNHLEAVVIEFHKPGSSVASARWDLPVRTTGSGVDDDMWTDKDYLRQLIKKARRPSPGDEYEISLKTSPGSRTLPNFTSGKFLSTGNMRPISGGTVIATNHVSAAATYWS